MITKFEMEIEHIFNEKVDKGVTSVVQQTYPTIKKISFCYLKGGNMISETQYFVAIWKIKPKNNEKDLLAICTGSM